MITFLMRHIGRAFGLSAFFLAIGFIVVWVSVLTTADLISAYEENDGLTTVLCLIGIESSDTLCPQTERLLAEARDARNQAEHQRAELERQITRLRELEDSVDRHTLFTTETPPPLGGIDVVTGSVYDSLLERSDPEEYCYASRPGESGVTRRVSLTSRHEERLTWSSLTPAMAAPLGLSVNELHAARAYCRFIGPGPVS